MERVIDGLRSHPCVALDSNVLLYYFEAHPEFGPLSRAVMREVANGLPAVTTALTMMDALVMPLRLKNRELYQEHLEGLTTFPSLRVIAIDQPVAERAAALRAVHPNLTTPTALTLAAGLLNGATLYITNDTRQLQLQEMRVLNLRTIAV